MADKKISELDLALLINNDAVFPMSQDNAGEPTTFKVGITQLGTEIAEDMTFSNLGTTSKKLVGAINELLSLGSPIIIGTTAPTSSQGANGNIYVQYTEGTGGADDEVDAIFVKIDGAWCEISTGGGSGTTDYEDLSNKPQVNSIELVGNKSLDDLGIMPASLSKTVSGAIAHFTDGADNVPVKSLVSQIVAVESGSGEKSPTNPYIISGFDSGVVSVCGKNLLSLNNVDFTLKSVRYYTSGGDFYLNGTSTGETSSKDTAFKNNLNFILKAGTYYFSRGNIGIATYLYDYYDDTKPAIVTNSGSFTLTEDTRVYIGFYVYNQTLNNLKSEIMVNVGSTATTYEAYNGTTYTFTFGQTVFGGYFDNKGNLVVTHGYDKLKPNETWNYSAGWSKTNTNVFFTSGLHTEIKYISNDDYPITHCTNFPVGSRNSLYASDTNMFGVSGSFGVGQLTVRVDKTICPDLASFVQWITDNQVYYVYELATPITLSITSQDIPTLLGENNIFSNTGDVEVDYYTDNADEIVEVAKATASTPLHNYSEDEQVVGTWIDGSTLYEKTGTFQTAIPMGSYANLEDLTSLNIDTVVNIKGVMRVNEDGDAIYRDYSTGLALEFMYNRGTKYLMGRQGVLSNTSGKTFVNHYTIRYTKSST